MINTTVSMIIGYGLLFISELLPMLPIPQQGVLHSIILAFTTAATSLSNQVMTTPPANALEILKDVQESVKTIQQAIPPPVSSVQTPTVQATPLPVSTTSPILKSGEYFPKYPPPPSNQQQQTSSPV